MGVGRLELYPMAPKVFYCFFSDSEPLYYDLGKAYSGCLFVFSHFSIDTPVAHFAIIFASDRGIGLKHNPTI